MSAVFLKISTTDVTQYVDIQKFNMNSEDIYESWTDANWVEHRVIARQKITGEVKVGFSSATDFSGFISLLSTARNSDGYYSVTAYVNNLGTTQTFDAYIDTEGEDKWDLTNSRQWQVITLKITGR